MGCLRICEHLFPIFLLSSIHKFYVISRLTSVIVLSNFNDNQTMYYNVILSYVRAPILAVEKK